MAASLRARDLTRPRRYGPMTRSRQRQPFSSVRAFYLTVGIFSLFAVYAFWLQPKTIGRSSGNHVSLQSRDLGAFASEEEDCRLVHTAKDQCAYIRRHCPDEDPGFLSYLELYYCRLPHAKPVAFAILVAWLALLFSTIGIAASDFFCIDLSTIATILGMSESMAGVTFLAFGNGSPDVFSTFAAMSTNSSSLAIGELIGAAGFITAVVAGSMALVRPFRVARKSFIRDVGFFVVAASFSMVFLADGRLHLWECIFMVVFYVFYVAVVVVWHWWLTRRLKKREREFLARGQWQSPGNEEIAVTEEYHDDDEEVRSSASRAASSENFSALERGSIPRIEEPDQEEEEELRDRWLGEVSSNMRVGKLRGRRNTITPVRPSLVGALEFQSVMKSLQRSRNIQTIPLSRRYSDDLIGAGISQDQQSTVSGPSTSDSTNRSNPELRRPVLDVRTASGNRARAVSTNDISVLKMDQDWFKRNGPKPSALIDIAEDESSSLQPPSSLPSRNASRSRRSSRSLSPNTHARPSGTSNLLAPPSAKMSAALDSYHLSRTSPQVETTPAHSPKSRAQSQRSLHLRTSSHNRSPFSSGPPSPFPEYRDDPDGLPSLQLPLGDFQLPSPSLGSPDDMNEEEKPPRWWPSRFLPSPWTLLATLFPTLYGWREKSWWARTLGLIAAPSVFLLTITLPVVEADHDEDQDGMPALDSANPLADSQGNGTAGLAMESPEILANEAYTDASSQAPAASPGKGVANLAANIEIEQHKNMPGASGPGISPPRHPHDTPDHKGWNLWLTIVQLYLAPLLIIFIIYTQYLPLETSQTFTNTILPPVLIALLTSTVLLIPLLLTTTTTHRPSAYQPILALAGFAISIAWISTIASQVVSVLKVLAVILNMSHAILGLTVFAVGNSLGDLVADITVARLGYPVMALSACFGGPMLNILLGIGLSGSWILIRGAEHRHQKHPDRPVKFRTYEIEVGDTLIVSGVVLLVTLVGLLVAVPLNRWMMTRRIAWALIALWCVGTVVNVVLEVVGIGENGASG